MKYNATIFILFILITPLITAQESALNAIRVVGNGELLTGELIAKDILDANGEVCAGLMIQTDLTGLTYDAYDGIVKINPNPGSDLLFLSREERVVTIYKSGYKPLKIILIDQGVKLLSGSVYKIEVTGDKILDLIPVNILVEPPGANITIDGEDKGSKTFYQLSPGKHSIVISKSGYQTKTVEIEVSTSQTLFNITLEKVSLIPVTITSTPKDATIFLNNSDKGQTDNQFFEMPGNYDLKLTKSGYLNIEEKITITNEGTNTLNYKLIKNSGTITFTTTPSDVEIRINTRLFNTKNIELVPGEYQIEVTKDGYLPYSETIVLNLGDKLQRTIDLMKNSGIITFTTTPSNAEIRINTQLYNSKKIELVPGTYEIEVSKDGYLPLKETIALNLGDSLYRNMNLAKNSSQIVFNITPSDAEFLINKKSYKGLNNFELAPGTYQVEINKEGYYSYEEIITVSLNVPISRTVNLTPKTGSLQFTIKPINAKVKLYKNDKVIEEWSGIKQIENLQIGNYKLEAKTDGYKTYLKKINIKENQVYQENALMEEGPDVSEGFVFVNGGAFEMGSSNRKVTIDDFIIGKFEVTQKQWKEVMGNNPSNFKGDNLPVEGVSWNDVQEFIRKLNEKTGENYRLPTEAEWGFTAAGGNKSNGYEYSGSNDIEDVGFYEYNSGRKTHPVGKKQPNELGIYDMSGNVWEWCSDIYDSFSSSTKSINIRGGSWSNYDVACRVNVRNGHGPDFSDINLGFRLAKDP